MTASRSSHLSLTSSKASCLYSFRYTCIHNFVVCVRRVRLKELLELYMRGLPPESHPSAACCRKFGLCYRVLRPLLQFLSTLPRSTQIFILDFRQVSPSKNRFSSSFSSWKHVTIACRVCPTTRLIIFVGVWVLYVDFHSQYLRRERGTRAFGNYVQSREWCWCMEHSCIV